MAILNTILIQHPNDPKSFIRINESDFKAGMVRWGVPAETQKQLAIPDDNSAGLFESKWHRILEEHGWRALKEEAEEIGFQRPMDVPWAECIDDIVEWERIMKETDPREIQLSEVDDE